MNTKKILTIIISGLTFYAHAQSYELATSTVTYVDLTNSNSLNGIVYRLLLS